MDLGALKATIIADISNFEKNMGMVQSTMAKVEKKTALSLGAMAQKFRTFGYLATATVTVPMIAAGKAAFTAAKDFEFAIQKMVGLAGVSQNTANEWSKMILAMSPEVGKGPKELAEGLYFISSSGQKGAAAMNILQLSAKAAAAGLGETKQVADLLTSAMNAYAGTGLTASYATDILVAAVREGKAEATAFAGSIGQIIPIASELGVSFDQVAGGMAAITLTGSSTSQAATYLKGVFNSLLKATMHGEKALNSMGSSYAELRDILRSKGVIAVMQKVRDLSVEYGEELSSEVFPNIRALTGYLSIAGKNFEYNKGIMDRVRESTGSLNVAYGAISKTIQQKFNQAVSQIQVSLVSLGQVIATAILPIMSWFAKILLNLTNWLTNMSDGWKKFVIGISLVTIALGPLALGISLIIYGFVGLKGIILGLVAGFKYLILSVKYLTFGFSGLGLAISEVKWAAVATGIGIVVAAIAALAFIIIKATKKTNELSEAQKIQQEVAAKYSSQLLEEQTVLGVLTQAIKDENISKEVRKNLLDEFNARYGSYLGYMITEENYVEKLSNAYDILNKGIIQRINLQSQLAQAEKLAASKADFIQKQAELTKIRPTISYALYNRLDKEYADQIKMLDEAIKSIVENITKLETVKTPFLVRVSSSMIDWLKKNKPDEYAAYIAKRTKEEAEAADKELQKLMKSMGILDSLNAQMTYAKEKEGKALSNKDIVKWQKEQLRIQKELDAYDPEKRKQTEIKSVEALQAINENKVKANLWSAEQEAWALYKIQLDSLNRQLEIQKGNAEKIVDLTKQREQLISDYTIKVKKQAAAKYISQMEMNWAVERMAADRNAELTIKDEEKRSRQIEANRLAEEGKKLGARTITAFITKTYDPKLLEDQKAYELAVERNSITELERLQKEARDKANALETKAGQLAQLAEDAKVLGAGEVAKRKREILIAFWAFEKDGEAGVSLKVEDMSRDELNFLKDQIEEKLNVIKDFETRRELIEKLGWVKAELRMKSAIDRMKTMPEVLNQQFTELAQNATFSIGESIGQILSGTGGMEEAFNSILGVIGDFLVGLGKAMITTGTVITAFKAALEALQPEVAIVLGIAAIAAGVALKNYVAKGPQFKSPTEMKDGGLLYGPTNVLAGEYEGARNNPEVFSPLSDLKKMIQPSYPLNERLVAEISGRKLQIVLTRESDYQNRGKR